MNFAVLLGGRYDEQMAASRVLLHLAKSLIRHPVVHYVRFATRGKCSCFKFVGFDIGRVCKGPLLDDMPAGRSMAGGLEPMEHRASYLWYDVEGFPACNTDMATGQLITNHTLLWFVVCQRSKVGGDIIRRMGVLTCPLREVAWTAFFLDRIRPLSCNRLGNAISP